jgi:(1->4)-alpha-D-glucan 1-alpha-D-glucosylmutase
MIENIQRFRGGAIVPRATYRVQFSEHFRLADGIKLVPYLHELGISHIYSSPLLKAAPHSAHGYDVRDFRRLNPELGTETDLENLVSALRERGMGLVLDIVPNHMSIGGRDNEWWWDVLTHGHESRYAAYFDIEWEPQDTELQGKVLLPVLADEYDDVLRRNELQIRAQEGDMLLYYGRRCFPLAPETLPKGMVANGGEAGVSSEGELLELNRNLPLLDRLIRRQHYLLVSWRQGDDRLNYRRFFNVSDLAGLRMEEEEVFEAAHELVRRWVRNGWIDGLRVDHPDGLRDPGQYLERLRSLAPNAWIIVEKILQPGESLRDSWPVNGSTGYDFLNQVTLLFVEPKGEEAFTSFYAEFTGQPVDYSKIVLEKKRFMLKTMFATEVKRLTGLLSRMAKQHDQFRGFKPDDLTTVIVEWMATLPVYRTFVQPERGEATEADLIQIEWTTEAIKRQQRMDPALLDWLRDLLSLRLRGSLEIQFMSWFQQLTGSVMAKGMEDTACYCFNRLISLNEVGTNPGMFGQKEQKFHESCQQRFKNWPYSMLATSTHDTKRGEDVRARISVLSEIPERWFATVRKWAVMTKQFKQGSCPDRNLEYFFYQTLVGAWPLTAERALIYMEKASRESQQFTSWNHPNESYDRALRYFVTAALEDAEFVRAVAEFVQSLQEAAQVNSLAQTLMKLTSPGVPDIYQGSELWDGSLVDPDNRRPVDFKQRRQLLSQADKYPAPEIWQRRETGLPKLWMIRKVLRFRQRHPEFFDANAGYAPVPARGGAANHVVAFMRGNAVITVVPRLVLGLNGNWGDTVLDLPEGNWRNELTGEDIFGYPATVASLLRNFPVAVLTRKEAGNA